MGKFVIPASIAFGLVLAYIIGQRIDDKAAMLILGVAIGAGISLPFAVLLIFVMRRQATTESDIMPPASLPSTQPQIIVVPQSPQPAYNSILPLPSGELGGNRAIRVVGEDED